LKNSAGNRPLKFGIQEFKLEKEKQVYISEKKDTKPCSYSKRARYKNRGGIPLAGKHPELRNKKAVE